MDETKATPPAPPSGKIGRAERDIVALGIITAAIILFVGTGGSVLPQIVRAHAGLGSGPDVLLTNALLLNVALVIFGWRRYTELTREVSDRRKAEEQAFILAQTDPLTGCLNRRSIAAATDAAIAQAHREGGAVAVLMIDLDNFKAINDLHGHQAGDAVLVGAVERIRAALPTGGLLARLGGDEFACVVRFEPDRPDMIDRLVTRLVEAVAAPLQSEQGTIDVTTSIGVVRSDAPSHGEPGAPAIDAHTLLHRADIAMYQAKKRGRNRYEWFEPAMEREIRFRSELETGIRRGIARGEFVPYYEQQIDLETGELTGFEMLARWHSPSLGLVSPEIFIPIAEEIGCIAELSELLISQALRDARDWDPNLTLSVNISPLQLRDPWFAQRLLKLLVEANFPPHRLDVEITESCLHENIGVVRTLVASLKNQGIGISLDDFGTGYSSLAQLRSLPFDRIKIDRSFVSNITSSRDSSKIIEAITSLGEGMQLPITAEGIETRQVLEELRRIGKFKGQGYLYGRPEPAEAVRARLAERTGRSAEAPAADTDQADPSAPPALRRSRG